MKGITALLGAILIVCSLVLFVGALVICVSYQLLILIIGAIGLIAGMALYQTARDLNL